MTELRRLEALPESMFNALPVLHLLLGPWAWHARPATEVVLAIYVVAWISGLLAFVGWRTAPSLIAFALSNLFLGSYYYSFGEFHHANGLVMIALVLLACSPAGAAWSMDARRTGRRATDLSPWAGWPLVAVRWLFGLSYASAALSWITLLFESTFFLAVLVPRLALIYVPLGAMLHLGIYLTMRANFLPWIALYAVFVPWTRVAERWSGQADWNRPAATRLVAHDEEDRIGEPVAPGATR